MTADVVTHSLLKAFRRCPRVALYKYHDELAPRTTSLPLRRGTWFHELMEAYYSGEDWKAVHKHNTHKFAQLFDEEKDALGDLPTEVYRLMRSYLWHYKNDADWDVHEVEFKLEVTLPNGVPWQGKSDMLVEDETGLWVLDHKTHKVIPSATQRLLDQQSIMYLWAARESGIPVRGFIWNYVKTSAPKVVRVTKAGTIAKNMGQTDYPTAFYSLKSQGFDPASFKPYLLPLARQRYRPGEIQTSPFFQRTVLEKSDAMIDRALAEAMNTSTRFMEYDFDDRDSVERVPDRSCDWCSYRNLCTTELLGGNTSTLLKQEFQQADPFGYYEKNNPLEEAY